MKSETQEGSLKMPDLLQDPRSREYLSPDDVDVIRRGLRLLCAKLQNTAPQDLPGAVMFTETSARPFAYLFRPVLQKLFAKLGAAPPCLRFILTQHHTDLSYEILKPDFDWEKSWEKAVAKSKRRVERRVERLTKTLREFDETRRGTDQGDQSELVEQIALNRGWLQMLPRERDGYRRAWEGLISRLQATAHELKRQGRIPRILIVDEHVYNGGTLRLLEAAYRNTLQSVPDLSVEYFTFRDACVNQCEGREDGFRQSLGDRLLAASDGVENFYFLEHGDAAGCVGVAKALDSTVVRPAAGRDTVKMRFLRSLMGQIGQAIAADYS